jgi:hypothetical protein
LAKQHDIDIAALPIVDASHSHESAAKAGRARTTRQG